MSQSQQAGFMPCMWLGGYSFHYAANKITIDSETTIATHDILEAKQQTEPVGYTVNKVTFNGFLFSTSNQALTDLKRFIVSGKFKNRPVGLGIFTSDNFSSSGSQPWFNGVGYLTSIHFEFPGGYAVYKYPFRFTWVEASPVTLIEGTTGDDQTYSFNMGGMEDGFIGGVAIFGTFGTGGAAQSITAVKDNTSATIGQAGILGISPGLFATGFNPLLVTANSEPDDGLFWPVEDANGKESIELAAAPTGTYTVEFDVVFSTPPTKVYLMYYPV
jgi:hypothetical protein